MTERCGRAGLVTTALRPRYDREMCDYHLMNRVAGEPGEYPLGDVEKEKLLQLALELSRFYSLDLARKPSRASPSRERKAGKALKMGHNVLS